MIDIKTRYQVFSRDKRTCIKCGGKHNLQIHHMNAKKYGGTDNEDNLVTLCDVCHIFAPEYRPDCIKWLEIPYTYQDIVNINNMLKRHRDTTSSGKAKKDKQVAESMYQALLEGKPYHEIKKEHRWGNRWENTD